MNSTLISFWNWAGVSAEEYALSGMSKSYFKYEDDFPYFFELVKCAFTTIDQSPNSPAVINDVLTIMALDNENEDVLDYLVNHCRDNMLEQILRLGVSHIQPHARWQIAELAYRTKVHDYKQYIVQLSNDEHPYVKKRAQNILDTL